MTPPQTLGNRQYKCNRAANSKALNSPHLLQKQVPKILKCRRVRGNESERAYADAKIDGIRLITKRKMRGVNSEE
jgi:hypothetical protein